MSEEDEEYSGRSSVKISSQAQFRDFIVKQESHLEFEGVFLMDQQIHDELNNGTTREELIYVRYC